MGGEDFDQRVMEHFIKMYKKKTGKDIRKDNRATQKLRREVEKAKRALSAAHQTRVEIESFIDGEDFSETLTRARFEELNMDLFRSTLKPVKKVMEDADLTKKDIDEIVLVGGSTRIPKVQQLVKVRPSTPSKHPMFCSNMFFNIYIIFVIEYVFTLLIVLLCRNTLMVRSQAEVSTPTRL